jgi:replicative DNA helicase
MAGSWEKHVAAIKDCAGRRKLHGLVQWLGEQVIDREKSLEELTAELVSAASKIISGRDARGKRRVANDVAASLSKPLPCFQTGLSRFDQVIGGGLIAGKAYGIAARKKVGKTVLLGTISHNLNRREVPHLFIALEMSPEEIEQRNMAREFHINSVKFLKDDRSRLARQAAEYATTIPDFTVYEHAPGASLDEIKRMVSRAIVQKGIKGVIVDYWQLIAGKARHETEEYHLRNAAQWLADVCRREGLWVVIAAQVNQDGNTRGGEGLKLSVDVYFTLHREKDADRGWLEMEESRYVLYANVGNETAPGLLLNKNGPYFECITADGEIS